PTAAPLRRDLERPERRLLGQLLPLRLARLPPRGSHGVRAASQPGVFPGRGRADPAGRDLLRGNRRLRPAGARPAPVAVARLPQRRRRAHRTARRSGHARVANAALGRGPPPDRAARGPEPPVAHRVLRGRLGVERRRLAACVQERGRGAADGAAPRVPAAAAGARRLRARLRSPRRERRIPQDRAGVLAARRLPPAPGREREDEYCYSGLMPASLTTFAHFAVSETMNLPKSSELICTASPPSVSKRFLVSLVASTLESSSCRRSITALGVPAGATMPHQFVAS